MIWSSFWILERSLWIMTYLHIYYNSWLYSIQVIDKNFDQRALKHENLFLNLHYVHSPQLVASIFCPRIYCHLSHCSVHSQRPPTGFTRMLWCSHLSQQISHGAMLLPPEKICGWSSLTVATFLRYCHAGSFLKCSLKFEPRGTAGRGGNKKPSLLN